MLNFTESNMAESEQRRWYAVDDGVMGGVSQSGFRVDAGAGCFGGEVSLENGGGFASMRREPNGFEPTLAHSQGVTLRVRGDGRTYQLRLKSSALDEASAYRVAFTPTAHQWETHQFTWAQFEAVRRGTGARALRSIFERIMLDVMYEIPSRDDVKSVTINRAVVEGKKGPTLRKKKKQDKDAA